MKIFGKTPLADYLQYTPVRCYEYAEQKNGLVDVLVPRFRDKFFGKILQPHLRHKYINANLDEIGSEAWKCCDGETKATEIAKVLSEKFGEKVHPADERLNMFLNQLYKNKFINFKEKVK